MGVPCLPCSTDIELALIRRIPKGEGGWRKSAIRSFYGLPNPRSLRPFKAIVAIDSIDSIVLRQTEFQIEQFMAIISKVRDCEPGTNAAKRMDVEEESIPEREIVSSGKCNCAASPLKYAPVARTTTWHWSWYLLTLLHPNINNKGNPEFVSPYVAMLPLWEIGSADADHVLGVQSDQ